MSRTVNMYAFIGNETLKKGKIKPLKGILRGFLLEMRKKSGKIRKNI